MTQPIAGATFAFTILVKDAADTDIAKANPTIDAANDFLISINGGSWDTLDNAPTVTPAGSEFISITLSAAETTAAGAGGYILLRVADAAGDEWIGGGYRFDVVAAATSTLTAAQVNAEVDTAIADVGLTTTITGRIDAAVSTVATQASVNTLAGYVDTEVAAILAAVDTEVAAIKAKTDNLPTDPADASDVASALTSATSTITTAVSATQTAIESDIAALNNLSAAEVAAELATYDAPTKAELDSAIATVATPAQVASALATYDAPTFAEMVTAFTEIKGATWASTDTLEAIRDRGDAAWITATGFATPTNVTDAQAAIMADTGSTETAVLAAVAALNNLTAAQVWAYAARTLTGTAASQTNPVVGSTINITRAATYVGILTGLSVPDGWTSARFTIKKATAKKQADSTSAFLQILVTATPDAADGLVILNQSSASLTAADATLAISGTTATITIADHITAQLEPNNYAYDIKFYHGSSASTVATEATCNVAVTPTQTV